MKTEPEVADHLGQRTVAGGAWLSASRLLQQGASLIQVTLLARLLDPSAFGLVGLANLSAYAVGVFVYTGFDAALIQKPHLDEDDIHTAWWVTLARYLALAFCLALLAAPIARLYRTPAAVPILLAFALIQPIQGLVSMSPILFRRYLQFRKLFLLDTCGALVSITAGVAAALVLRNVWALVIGYLATALALLVLSYRLHSYRPQRRFDRLSARRLLSYGQWLLGSNVLWFVSTQGASAFSGWMFGMTALGLYQMAARFALLPSTQMGDVICSTLVPAYAQIQGDIVRVSKAFLKALELAAVLIIGMSAILALCLPRLLVLLLGNQWTDAAALVPAIALAGGAQALLRTGTPLYLGTGHPRYQFQVDLAQAIVMVCLLYPLGRSFGLAGLPFAALGGAVCALPLWWRGVRRSTVCTLRDTFAACAPAVLGVAAMAVVLATGRIPVAAQAGTLAAIIWYIILIVVAGMAFLVTIGLCQKLVPQYTPLAQLSLLLGHRRLRPRQAITINAHS